MTKVIGYNVWFNAAPRPYSRRSKYDTLQSLRNFFEMGCGRNDANRMAIDYLRAKYGIWK